MEKISIVIPVYNSEKYLERCLNSIINQTYKNIEIICVNDGSKDSSLEILKKYKNNDDRLVIIDKLNEGVSAARNDAIKQATGEYVTFVDSDDWLEKDAIESLYNTIKEQNVDVVRGNFFINYIYDKNEATGDLGELKNKRLLTNKKNFGELVINKLLDGRIQCYVVLLMIKKKFLNDNLLFKEEISFMEDVIFYNELMTKIESIYFLDKPIYHYYSNPNSASKSKDFFIRNIYNVLDVDKYIVEIIKKSKFNNETRFEIRKAFNVKTIMGYLYAMYIASDDKDKIKNEIDKLINNEEIYELLSTANLSLLPQGIKKYIEKILLKLILKRNYNKLFAFYKLRSKLEGR